MTSVVTNPSASAALATLRLLSSEMGKVQNEASSGYKVASASDNAAYWSIATTMRSDSRALSSVSDALGLGMATADTAYLGITSAIDVLDSFKAKLVAAKERGVDKHKIQSELEEYKSQFTSIASSASFSGQNWLSTDISDIYDPAQGKSSLVSSFQRDGSGNVSIQSTTVDVSSMSLFNTTGGGILQKDERSPGSIGGLRAPAVSGSGGFASQGPFSFSGPLVFTDDSTAITFDITLGADDPANTPSPGSGLTQSVTINRTFVDSVSPFLNGVVSTRTDFERVLALALKPKGATVGSGGAGGYSVISGLTSDGPAMSGYSGASVYISNLTSTMASGSTGGLTNSTATAYGSRAKSQFSWDGAFSVNASVDISVPVVINSVSSTLHIDRALVDSALGTTTGDVTSAQDLVTVLNAGMANQGIGGRATVLSPSQITFEADPAVNPQSGEKSHVSIGSATDNLGVTADFDIKDVDVTTNAVSLDNYIDGLEGMMSKLTKAGATLGSLQKRISFQADFTEKLMSTLEKGVGRLVDADMSETSTRLKAVQTQEQLALQSLNIANSQSSTILQLFR